MTVHPGSTAVAVVIARTHREEWTRVVAGLARRFGDLDIAEDMAAEAFATAAERWPTDGIPSKPGAWIATTARRKAIDRLRREARRQEKHAQAALLEDASAPCPSPIDDDRLRLLFICCHPVLSHEAQVALTLRAVGGLTVAEIAHAFRVRETTMGQRISRAKAKIKAARVPFRSPDASEVRARVDGVLAVLYLIFNEGYLTSQDGMQPLRRDLTAEAIRLTRLTRELVPQNGEAEGLLSMMLLTEARANARLSGDGELVRLDTQNRDAWDRALIDEALQIVRAALRDHERSGTDPGRYLLSAAINAVHIRAPHAAATDWVEIVSLYSRLERIDSSPIVQLNKTIAIAEADSPVAALQLLDQLEGELADHHAFHVTKGELLFATQLLPEALTEIDRAMELTTNTAELTHLRRRRRQMASFSQDATEGDTHEQVPRPPHDRFDRQPPAQRRR